MTPDPIDEPSRPDLSKSSKSFRRGGNGDMEFDFGLSKSSGKKAGPRKEDASYPKLKPPAASPEQPQANPGMPKIHAPEAEDASDAEFHISSPPKKPSREFRSQATMNPTATTFSQYEQNIKRQTREQSAVGNLLSGVAVTLIASILIVAILASFGGWVLYRQIQNQSVTVSQLDSKMTADLQTLRGDLHKTSLALDQAETLVQSQKQQITWLQTQLEDVRATARRDGGASQLRLQKIEKRLADIERREGVAR